jgi:hypothetical protein
MISHYERPEEAVIVIFCSLPVKEQLVKIIVEIINFSIVIVFFM